MANIGACNYNLGIDIYFSGATLHFAAINLLRNKFFVTHLEYAHVPKALFQMSAKMQSISSPTDIYRCEGTIESNVV